MFWQRPSPKPTYEEQQKPLPESAQQVRTLLGNVRRQRLPFQFSWLLLLGPICLLPAPQRVRIALFGCALVCFFLSSLFQNPFHRIWGNRTLKRELPKVTDAYAIAQLAHGRSSSSEMRWMNPSIDATIERLLPGLNREIWEAWEPEDRGSLASLCASAPPSLAVATLEKIGELGDSALVPIIAELTSMELYPATRWEFLKRHFLEPHRSRITAEVKEAAHRCLDRLTGSPARESELLTLTPEEIAEITRFAQSHEWRQSVGLILSILTPVLVALLVLTHDKLILSGRRSLVGIILALQFASLYIVFYPLLPRQAQMRRKLERLDDVRAIAPLLDIGVQTTHLRTPLLRLLPRLNASDANLLNGKQRAKLYNALLPPERGFYDRPLALAILTALEQIGDKDALPILERLIATVSDAEIRHKAEEILPALAMRLKEAAANRTLLRPAGEGEPLSETLLRPAQNVSEEAHLLLRADRRE